MLSEIKYIILLFLIALDVAGGDGGIFAVSSDAMVALATKLATVFSGRTEGKRETKFAKQDRRTHSGEEEEQRVGIPCVQKGITSKGGLDAEECSLKRAFYTTLRGADDPWSARTRNPTPTLNVYGIGSIPADAQRHPLAVLAGAPAQSWGPSSKGVQAVARVVIWCFVRLMHKIAWGMHLISDWVEKRDTQLKLQLARGRGRALNGLNAKKKLRPCPIIHLYSEDRTVSSKQSGLSKLLDPDNYQPGREYALEMQRQAYGKGYHRRSPPLAMTFPFLRASDRHGAKNILLEGGRDWLPLDGCSGEVILDLGRVRTVLAVSLTNAAAKDRAARGFGIDVSTDMLSWECRVQGNLTLKDVRDLNRQTGP